MTKGIRVGLAICLLAPVVAFFGAALAQEKGGEPETGPYSVVEGWPKPLGHTGWTWGSQGGVFAETPNRIYLLQRGELPLPPKAPEGYTGGYGAFGQPATQGTPRLEHCILIVDGNGNLLEDWTQWDHLFIGGLRGLLEAVNLTQFGKSLVATFSGGMRRRLEVARGLVHSPKILFLDEPTTGLDPVSRTGVWEMIQKLKAQAGLTLILTTHYMDEADRLCDRIAIVDHGELATLDTPSRLKDSVPGTDVVEAEFEGAPANWSEVLAKLPQVASVKVQDNVVRLSSHNGPDTVGALMATAAKFGVKVRRVGVQGTTLDDVFLHYTGRQLRDSAGSAGTYDVSHLYNR